MFIFKNYKIKKKNLTKNSWYSKNVSKINEDKKATWARQTRETKLNK